MLKTVAVLKALRKAWLLKDAAWEGESERKKTR
jgi:hypothetical protein